MGAEMTHRTRKALLDAVRERAVQILDHSIEATKDANPFLHGVPALLEALRSGQIECRVYDKDKFHAKAYIAHAKLEVIGSQALVGSSNFTSPGLTKNIELNIQVQRAREVAQLQEWFEIHWNDASDVTDAVITTMARQTHLYTPFDVYAKALQEHFRGHELTSTATPFLRNPARSSPASAPRPRRRATARQRRRPSSSFAARSRSTSRTAISSGWTRRSGSSRRSAAGWK